MKTKEAEWPPRSTCRPSANGFLGRVVRKGGWVRPDLKQLKVRFVPCSNGQQLLTRAGFAGPLPTIKRDSRTTKKRPKQFGPRIYPVRRSRLSEQPAPLNSFQSKLLSIKEIGRARLNSSHGYISY